jgi:hypothetical protein
MLFHVTWETYPTVVLDDDKRVREAVGPQLQRLMQSDKVREAGIFRACANRRVAYVSRSSQKAVQSL